MVAYDYDETIHDLDRVEDAIKRFRPKVLIVVHCETPSGTLNPLDELGALKKRYDIPVMIVDVVSSISCALVRGDDWNADIILGGTQKGLSLPPTHPKR